ncbi:MBL fold metallo-hydrolase [Streptomyces europaeiscabiei]|uniref:MBL fold metallo-hydrolase n=1 Tax=Streptomyces europaeiscabiei TaxID=146819 RepID=UPI0038F794E4
MVWSPISTTLIHGENDAVVVDPPITTDITREVSPGRKRPGLDIAEICITHGHDDHWLGAPILLERFPYAVVRASAGTKGRLAGLATAESPCGVLGRAVPRSRAVDTVDMQVVTGEGRG